MTKICEYAPIIYALLTLLFILYYERVRLKMNEQFYGYNGYNMNRQPMRPNGPRPGRPGPGMPPGGGNQGRFLGPFILGGITGGLISPLFWNNRPMYYPYYPPYGPYPYYYR